MSDFDDRLRGLRVQAALSGNLEKELRRQRQLAAQALTAGLKSGILKSKTNLLRQIRRMKIKSRLRLTRLDTTIKSKTSRRATLAPEGRLYSVARYKAENGRRQQPIDLIMIFMEGTTITPAEGKFLAIPTAEAPIADGRSYAYATPTDCKIPLRFIPTKKGGVLVRASDRSDKPTVLYWLIRQARISKRLDQDAALAAGIDRMTELVAYEWDKRAAKAGLITG